MADGEFTYQGQELETFAEAHTWKNYWKSFISTFLTHGEILEVGAGLGANTAVLCHSGVKRWLCLEPDATLATCLQKVVRSSPIYDKCEVRYGTVSTLEVRDSFDAILYLDVLEHIEHDAAELETATAHLKPRGVLIVLAPAHQQLLAEFDRSIGHLRRYSRQTLEAAVPARLRRELLTYLDSAGLLASIANRYVLNDSRPSRWKILVWDRLLVRASMIVDPLFSNMLGKSVLGVWRAPDG